MLLDDNMRKLVLAAILIIILASITVQAEQVTSQWKTITIDNLEPGVYRVKLMIITDKPVNYLALIVNGAALKPKIAPVNYSGVFDNWYSYLIASTSGIIEFEAFTSNGKINITLASSGVSDVKVLSVQPSRVDFNKPYININFNAALCGLIIKVDGEVKAYYDKDKCMAYGIAEEAVNIRDSGSIVEVWVYWKKGGYAYAKLKAWSPSDAGQDTIDVLKIDGCHPLKSWPYLQAWVRGIVYVDIDHDGKPDTHYSPQSAREKIKYPVCSYSLSSTTTTKTTTRYTTAPTRTTTITKTITVTRTTTLPRITTTTTQTVTTTVVNNVTSTITVTKTIPVTETTTVTAVYPTTTETTTVLAAGIAAGEENTLTNKYFYIGLGAGILLASLALLARQR